MLHDTPCICMRQPRLLLLFTSARNSVNIMQCVGQEESFSNAEGYKDHCWKAGAPFGHLPAAPLHLHLPCHLQCEPLLPPSIIVIVVSLTCLTHSQVSLTRIWLTVSSLLLSFVFVFGNSIRAIYESVVYLFVVRPFDIGDAILLGPAQDWCTVGRSSHT